jgi:hypothetical protein
MVRSIACDLKYMQVWTLHLLCPVFHSACESGQSFSARQSR